MKVSSKSIETWVDWNKQGINDLYWMVYTVILVNLLLVETPLKFLFNMMGSCNVVFLVQCLPMPQICKKIFLFKKQEQNCKGKIWCFAIKFFFKRIKTGSMLILLFYKLIHICLKTNLWYKVPSCEVFKI